MIADPLFWLCAVIAVLMMGISKGGIGGLGLASVPLMALTIGPIQAAAIMLPILIVMDWVGVWSYRKYWDKTVLVLMLPFAVFGIFLGWLLAGYVNERFVLISVGVIAVLFPVYAVFKPQGEQGFIKDNKPFGIIAAIIAGFTSFVAHAGGPPFKTYVIPQGLDKRVFAGTGVMFFFVVNFVKLLPYAMLGQFDATNIKTSLMLIPLAPVGVLIGVWLVNVIDQAVFFKIIYALIFAVGVKLLWDGIGF